MALTPRLAETGKLHLRILLSDGEIPQWIADLLLALDRIEGLALQLVRIGASVPSPLSLPARCWHAALPPLRPWAQDSIARSSLARWQAAAGEACDIRLVVDGATLPPASDTDQGALWVVVDGEERALSPHFPLLDSICAGAGIHLKLLQREDRSDAWRLRRSLHVAAPASYARSLPDLAPSLLRLVRQAVTDWQLGIPPAASSAARCRAAQAATAPCWSGLKGRLRHFQKRLRAQLFSEYWRIGVLDAPIDLLLHAGALPKVRWLTPERISGYRADPFALPGDSQWLFCEYLDQFSGVGHLEALRMTPSGELSECKPLAVGQGRHASFPNVLEIDGRYFGVAETVARRECVLYEVDTDARWHPLFPLLSDVAAADPALFLWEGRWWLAFTDIDQGELDNLCLYHADRLEGPWLPHANNPVKIDIGGARMAGGFFRHDGELYRPAQDCLQAYGASVVLHRIVRLTPECFEEIEVRRLLPDRHGACPHGLHTLNAWGERTLIDGKRHGINPLVLRRNLLQRLRRIWVGLTGPAAPRRVAGKAKGRSRVMVYIPHLRMGGGEISMLRLAEGLAATGLDVCVLVHSAATRELPLPIGVSFIDLNCGGTLAAFRGLLRVLREERPDWLLSAFPHTNIAAVTALALSGLETRCIITEHAPLSRQIAQQDNWRYRLLPPLVRWAYRRADAVVAVSAGVREDLQLMLGTDIPSSVIHNPVLVDGFEAEMAVLPDDPWLTDGKLKVVLSVCRLSVEKDLPTLVRAFAELHRSHPETRLLLAGEGGDRARIESLVRQMGLADVVRLPGRTATPLAWMRRAAVFVLASRYEGFGNVLVEAMACGIPVVSTDCPVGPREILDGGRLGALVPVGDVSAMARAIAEALEQPVPPAARQAALLHTQASACAKYRQLFESLSPEGMAC